ncbi:hypothetical protein [Psychroflexus sp. MBR-150]|jgi:hypothetical protein
MNNQIDSKRLVRDICIKIKEFQELKYTLYDIEEKYNEEKLKENYDRNELLKLKELKKNISENLDELHKRSQNDNYFYPDCPFDVFKHNFQERNKSYSDKDFLRLYTQKYAYYSFIDMYRFLYHGKKKFYYHPFINNNNVEYDDIKEKKVIYFEERIRRLGSTPDINRLKKPIDNKNKTLINSNEKLNEILKKIVDKVKFYDTRIAHYNDELEYNHNKGIEDDISLEIKIDDLNKDISYYVTKYLKELQKLSLEYNYYFFDCPFDVYRVNYYKRKNEYLNNSIDTNEADFIMVELNKTVNYRGERYLTFENKKYHYHNLLNDVGLFYNSELKKQEYLKLKLSQLGWEAYQIEDENKIPSHYHYEKNDNYKSEFLGDNNLKEVQIMDNEESNKENKTKMNDSQNSFKQKQNKSNNQLTANQAVILLDKIGFFSHSYIEYLSKSRQAQIISKLIGKDKKNISDYISKLENTTQTDSYIRDLDKIDNLLDT